MTKELPSKEYLQTLFEYTEDGNLWWREYKSGRNMAKPSGNEGRSQRYKKVTIDGVRYYLHRVIYQFHFGDLDVTDEIDHIDRNGHNNRVNNLRKVTHTGNSLNRKIRGDSKTGYQGVQKVRNRYKTTLTIDGKRKFLGYFDTPEEASKCYQQAKQSITNDQTIHSNEQQTVLTS